MSELRERLLLARDAIDDTLTALDSLDYFASAMLREAIGDLLEAEGKPRTGPGVDETIRGLRRRVNNREEN